MKSEIACLTRFGSLEYSQQKEAARNGPNLLRAAPVAFTPLIHNPVMDVKEKGKTGTIPFVAGL